MMLSLLVIDGRMMVIFLVFFCQNESMQSTWISLLNCVVKLILIILNPTVSAALEEEDKKEPNNLGPDLWYCIEVSAYRYYYQLCENNEHKFIVEFTDDEILDILER